MKRNTITRLCSLAAAAVLAVSCIALTGCGSSELTGALAVFMTILLLGPLNFILDKLWKKPAEPMWLCVVPEGGTVKVTAVRGLEGNPRTPAEILVYAELVSRISLFYQDMSFFSRFT